MQNVNISLPDQLKEYIDTQIGSGRYSSASEYVRQLILEDEKRRAQESLEALLLEGIASGEATEFTRREWDEIRGDALRQFETSRKRKTP